jgi:hypothetical protein
VTAAVLERVAKGRIPLVPWSVDEQARLNELLKHDCVAGVITRDVKGALEAKRWL